MSLADFGLTDALRSLLKEDDHGGSFARVLAANRTNYLLQTESGPAIGEVTGRVRHLAESSMDLPGVGDWVSVQAMDDLAIILHVHDRTSVLRRRDPSEPSAYQLIAANVDTAFIVHAANQPLHHRRLERYLVAARDGGVEPVIVLSKSDLVEENELRTATDQATELAETIAISSVSDGGLDLLKAHMENGKTYALLGPSGVGKSTLLNGLLDADVFATSEVRNSDQKGRHTTTRRELVLLPGGAMVIDTPGMREFGMTDVADGIDETFDEIAVLAEACRFRDCTHTVEHGCAVIQAVEEGRLGKARLDSYLRLEREAAHFERTHLESRKRDKAFGKMYKAVMKEKKGRR